MSTAADRSAVTTGALAFYRGGAPLRDGPAYFTSAEWMAEFYGPVQEHRLTLRSPRFVDQNEWTRFDSICLRLDPSPIAELVAQGHDGAVWATDTPSGRVYTVYALDGLAVSSPPTR